MKTSTLYAVTPEVTELIKIKYQKKKSYFQPEDNHEIRVAETEIVSMHNIKIAKALSYDAVN